LQLFVCISQWRKKIRVEKDKSHQMEEKVSEKTIHYVCELYLFVITSTRSDFWLPWRAALAASDHCRIFDYMVSTSAYVRVSVGCKARGRYR
jgi:hypothetical protein